MGARLQYAKVIDRELFYSRGGRIHPGLVNEVALKDGQVVAGAFLVLRAWTDDHGSFTEQWRSRGPGVRSSTRASRGRCISRHRPMSRSSRTRSQTSR